VKSTVLFDLGGTLVEYYSGPEFPEILRRAIKEVREHLRETGLLRVSIEDIWARVEKENHEAEGNRVRPLEDRLARIFGLDDSVRSSGLTMDLCRCFMKPIFARARVYEDALPTLQGLRSRGLRTAIVSNTPWGSPAELWREEVERVGLTEHVDALVFCSDVGWRKPDPRVFQFVLEKLDVTPQECLFVGDDPRWDLVGPRAVGIEAALIDRRGLSEVPEEDPIRSLDELAERFL
jgi:putative hydrolase of the HAD superfamily